MVQDVVQSILRSSSFGSRAQDLGVSVQEFGSNVEALILLERVLGYSIQSTIIKIWNSGAGV